MTLAEILKDISDRKQLTDDEKADLYAQAIEKYGRQKDEKRMSIINSPGAVVGAHGAIVGANISGNKNSNFVGATYVGSCTGSVKISGSQLTINSSKTNVDNREGVMQRSNIGISSDKPFSKCPYCGEGLNLPKTPKFCPHCGETITI